MFPYRSIVQGVLLCIVLCGKPSYCQGRTEEIDRLCSPDIPTMVSASDSLCALEERAIPGLISLLDDEHTIVPISPLGAPGSVMYDGHGGWGACFSYVPYGLNEAQIRAGWLLERITFQDFGFATTWEGTGFRRPDRKIVASVAKKWWSSRNKNWDRFTGLQEALTGNSMSAQMRALYYLQNNGRDGSCRGLTQSAYLAEIHPSVRKLMGSESQGIRELAAGIWVQVEERMSPENGQIFLDKVHPSDREEQIYFLKDGSLTRDGQTIATIGDSLELLHAKVSTSQDWLGSPALDTVPSLVLSVTGGKIVSWSSHVYGEGLPWEPAKRSWR